MKSHPFGWLFFVAKRSLTVKKIHKRRALCVVKRGKFCVKNREKCTFNACMGMPNGKNRQIYQEKPFPCVSPWSRYK